jgi:hypothetical protein
VSLFLPGTDTLFESGLDNLIQHMRTNSVVAGCDVNAHAAPDMGVRVLAGSIQGNGIVVAVGQTDLVVAASGANPRLDLVHVDMTTGVPAIIAGTPAANPKPPALPANSIELGLVGVAAGALNIQAANIANRRLIAQVGAKFQGFVSIGTGAAASGAARFANNTSIVWRNAAGTGDVTGLRVAADNTLTADALFTALSSMQIPDGTVGGPGIRFINQGGSGLYRNTNLIGIAVNGVDGLVINVGTTIMTAANVNAFAIGTNPAGSGVHRVPNNASYNARNAANTADKTLLRLSATDVVEVGDAALNLSLLAAAGSVDFRYATTALGGGAAPTLGTIGGAGPAAAAQNSWLKVLINGTASYLAVWR